MYYYKEKGAKKPGMRRTYFRTGSLLVKSVWRHFRSKLSSYSSKKKHAGKIRAYAEHTSGQGCFLQGLFRSRDSRHFRSKGATRSYIAQLPVAHGHIILPDRAPVTWLTSLSIRAGDVTSGYMTSGHMQWSDPPKYYFVRPHILLTYYSIKTSNTQGSKLTWAQLPKAPNNLAGILEIEVYFGYLDRIGLLKNCFIFPCVFPWTTIWVLVLLCMGYIPVCLFWKLIFFNLFWFRLCMKY